MKICLNPYVEGSGIGTYILELANYLAENTEHEIIAIGDTKLAHHPRMKVYQTPKKNSFWTQVPPISWFYFVWEDYKISRLVNKLRPDIFINSDHLVFNKVKCPTYAVGWDYPKGLIGCIKLAARYEEWWKLPYRVIREMEMSLKDSCAFSHAKLILGVTNHVTRKLQKKGYPAQYYPPGIKILPNHEKKFKKFTITFVARNHIWTKRKGLKYLLEALKILEKEKLEYDLNIIGNIPNDSCKRFKKYNSIKRHIILKGLLSRNETLKIIKKSHLLAAPSLYEEFGFSILEAASYGIPVIGSKSNRSSNEILGTHSGLIINIFNVKEFSRIIYKLIVTPKLLNNLRKKLTSQIKNNFSFELNNRG